MRIFFSLLLTLGMVTPVLAQGKVHFANNSLHLVYWDPFRLKPQDEGLAGQAYEFGQAGVTFAIELWAGTATTSLSLVASTSFSNQASPGAWLGYNLVLPFPGGTMDFFQILIYDQSAGSYQNASQGYFYTGATPVFTAFASAGIAYYFLTQHTSPTYSTWDDGTFNLDNVSPGFRGAIDLSVTPEPPIFGLSGLACALLVIRRCATSQSRLRKPGKRCFSASLRLPAATGE
jgi:hypothetical protein